MGQEPRTISLTRRKVLALGGAALAAGVSGATVDLLSPQTGDAQTPKRGGVFRLPVAQPPMFDHQLTVNWRTQIAVSFTHSRLLKVKAGPPSPRDVSARAATSRSRGPSRTRRPTSSSSEGVRWHPKPPVNGRELTAEDVKYTYERFLTIPGNGNKRACSKTVDKIEAVDKYTVKFTLKEPYAWFLDLLASTSTWIIAKEVRREVRRSEEAERRRRHRAVDARALRAERAHDLRPPPATTSFPGCRTRTGSRSRCPRTRPRGFAGWLSGKYDFGPEYSRSCGGSTSTWPAAEARPADGGVPSLFGGSPS